MGCDFSSIGNFSVSVRDCHIKDVSNQRNTMKIHGLL